MQLNSCSVYLEKPEAPIVSPFVLIVVLTLFFLIWLSIHPLTSLERIKQGALIICTLCLFFFATKGIENA
jgi:hypothetical protein